MNISFIFFSYLVFAIYAFVLFQAFPLEILRPCGRMWLLVVPFSLYTTVTSSTPGLFHLLEICYCSSLFMIYFKIKNVLGIVLAYLLIAEWDPW